MSNIFSTTNTSGRLVPVQRVRSRNTWLHVQLYLEGHGMFPNHLQQIWLQTTRSMAWWYDGIHEGKSLGYFSCAEQKRSYLIAQQIWRSNKASRYVPSSKLWVTVNSQQFHIEMNNLYPSQTSQTHNTYTQKRVLLKNCTLSSLSWVQRACDFPWALVPEKWQNRHRILEGWFVAEARTWGANLQLLDQHLWSNYHKDAQSSM